MRRDNDEVSRPTNPISWPAQLLVQHSLAQLKLGYDSLKPIGSIMRDVDHFKSSDDKLEHASGDEAPATVAEGIETPIAGSLGIASCDGGSFDGLLERADKALHVAKRTGENRSQIFDQSNLSDRSGGPL